ncbi:MAG: hypothetical protein IT305_08120 [Chloroflexi bacterium]|nr:hypothetical protein [Chloroflexota bacterium]
MSENPPDVPTAAQTPAQPSAQAAARTTVEGDIDLDPLRKELEETTLICDPSGIDAELLRIAPEDRHQCGLPPEPDERTEPAQYRFWHDLFEPLPRFVDPEFRFVLHQFQRTFPVRTAVIRTSHEGSRNWSGAYITPRDGLMFTGVFGAWRIPEVSRPDGTPSENEYGSSTWIGLDGQRKYLDSSLPQIGTAHYLVRDGSSLEPKTWAWWQWWNRDQPAPPVELALKVSPGHLILCALLVVNATQVMFLIKNQDTSEMCKPFIKTAPKARMPDGTDVQVRISGATAEWVMERPAEWPTDRLYELPDYGTVTFSRCFSVAAPDPGRFGREETVEAARLIRMYAVKERPDRTLTISTAKRSGPFNITASYVPEGSLQFP